MMPAFRTALRAVLVVAVLGATTIPIVAAACTTAESLTMWLRQASPGVDTRLVKEPSAPGLRQESRRSLASKCPWVAGISSHMLLVLPPVTLCGSKVAARRIMGGFPTIWYASGSKAIQRSGSAQTSMDGSAL